MRRKIGCSGGGVSDPYIYSIDRVMVQTAVTVIQMLYQWPVWQYTDSVLGFDLHLLHVHESTPKVFDQNESKYAF